MGGSERLLFFIMFCGVMNGGSMAKYKFTPILTPENINRLHRELSAEAQRTIDDMADYMAERYCERCRELFPEESIKGLRREKAREIIYVLVLHNYL